MAAIRNWLYGALSPVLIWGQCGLMSWDEYRAMRHPVPYVLRLEGLVMFGSRHSRDPNHPEMAGIEKLWREFRPDIAFSEGGVRPAAASRDEAIVRYGEAGLLRFLADRDHVPIRSLEPDRQQSQARLAAEFGAARAKEYYERRDSIDPVRNDGVLNEIARRESDFRNCHMAPLVIEAVRSGKRVFVVVGGTHVVLQEPALRSALPHHVP